MHSLYIAVYAYINVFPCITTPGRVSTALAMHDNTKARQHCPDTYSMHNTRARQHRPELVTFTCNHCHMQILHPASNVRQHQGASAQPRLVRLHSPPRRVSTARTQTLYMALLMKGQHRSTTARRINTAHSRSLTLLSKHYTGYPMHNNTRARQHLPPFITSI